ncbi:MAG: asparaginase, partial [Rhodospirillaceae bacterium]
PEMVRGTHGVDTAVMRAGAGRVATKTGAEGVHIAMVPERKLGVALKVEDGASRASGVAICALLDRLGLFDAAGRDRLKDLIEVPIGNTTGCTVGAVRVQPGWTG